MTVSRFRRLVALLEVEPVSLDQDDLARTDRGRARPTREVGSGHRAEPTKIEALGASMKAADAGRSSAAPSSRGLDAVTDKASAEILAARIRMNHQGAQARPARRQLVPGLPVVVDIGDGAGNDAIAFDHQNLAAIPPSLDVARIFDVAIQHLAGNDGPERFERCDDQIGDLGYLIAGRVPDDRLWLLLRGHGLGFRSKLIASGEQGGLIAGPVICRLSRPR